MEDMITALSVDVEEDLLPLTALLRQRGVAHRIYEEGGRQVLKVPGGQQQAQQVAALYRSWRAGEVKIELSSAAGTRSVVQRSGQWRSAPVTVMLVLLSIAGFLVIYLGAPLSVIGEVTFTPFTVVEGQLRFGDRGVEYWRVLTPACLEFGWLHSFIFNFFFKIGNFGS